MGYRRGWRVHTTGVGELNHEPESFACRATEHFSGAHSLSFGDGVQLADGDVMNIHFDGFGRALRNPVSVARPAEGPVSVQPLS
jgi:hypothetical protein